MIKEALIKQIKEVISTKHGSSDWFYGVLCQMTGRKKPTNKKIPTTRKENINRIENELRAAIRKIGECSSDEVKEFIKNGGAPWLTEWIKKIDLTKLDSDMDVKKRWSGIDSMIKELSEEQLWSLHSDCITFNLDEWQKKQEEVQKQSDKSGNYISIPESEAVRILADHYIAIMRGRTATTPECFRTAKVSNPNQHFSRFLFSSLFADKCDKPFNINEDIYKNWKKSFILASADEEEAREIIKNYIENHENHLNQVYERLANKPYVQAVLKK